MTSLDLTNKTEELNHLGDIFSQSQLNKLINERLKKIAKIENCIELSNLNSTSANNYNFNKYLLLIV